MRTNIILPKHLIKKNINVLVIGDTHIPAQHKDYLEFLLDTYKKYKCNYVIHVGDLIDHSSISYHEKDPDLYSVKEEMTYTKHEIIKWYQVFPYMSICKGNHSRLIERKLRTAGLSKVVMRKLEDIYEMPVGWKFYDEIILNNVKYTHGDSFSGKHPNYTAMINNRCNSVIGHLHSILSINYHNNGTDTIWGLSVGCGVDNTHPAMNYAKYHRSKPVIGCGVVLNNGTEPHCIPMK